MMSNWNDKVLYTGITNNLERRVYEHKNKLTKGFTAKYNINKLVYFEYTEDVTAAISREKQILVETLDQLALLIMASPR